MSKDQPGPRPADDFVSFGISGDLPRNITFLSAYHPDYPRTPRRPHRGSRATARAD